MSETPPETDRPKKGGKWLKGIALAFAAAVAVPLSKSDFPAKLLDELIPRSTKSAPVKEASDGIANRAEKWADLSTEKCRRDPGCYAFFRSCTGQCGGRDDNSCFKECLGVKLRESVVERIRKDGTRKPTVDPKLIEFIESQTKISPEEIRGYQPRVRKDADAAAPQERAAKPDFAESFGQKSMSDKEIEKILDGLRSNGNLDYGKADIYGENSEGAEDSKKFLKLLEGHPDFQRRTSRDRLSDEERRALLETIELLDEEFPQESGNK